MIDYLNDIYRLSYIKRYSNVPKVHEESVAEHGFFVAAIVLFLYEKYEFNLRDALIIAVAHDMTEMELNDCPWIIKKKYPQIAKAYRICEEDVAMQLPKTVGWGAQQFDDPIQSLESKIVHLADAMQCLQFSHVEVNMGNEGYMREVYENSKRRISILERELSIHERPGHDQDKDQVLP